MTKTKVDAYLNVWSLITLDLMTNDSYTEIPYLILDFLEKR